MLDPGFGRTPYELAAQAIQDWLDGPGSTFAVPSRRAHNRGKMHVWDLELVHPSQGSQRAEICISIDFPAVPPAVYLPKRLCLVWPHVEETGLFCHGVQPSPDDYDNPVGAVKAVLTKLEDFWQNTQDPAWIQTEFQRESLSYWARFCLRQRALNGGVAPICARVNYSQVDDPVEGRVAAYFSGQREKRITSLLANLGDTDPHSLATRHGWSHGTLKRGGSLFIPLPDSFLWTPDAWPTSIDELNALVSHLTGDTHRLKAWLIEKSHKFEQILMVVFVQSDVCYGYLLEAPTIPGMSRPRITPIYFDRVDANWALARDQNLGAVDRRRSVKALVLGCGSLGSMVIEHLARAGVGSIDIVDKESFDAANCARHVLGADSIDLGKANEMASRLLRLVPSVRVNAHRVKAERWVPSQCRPGQYDVVVDLTGEAAVRSMLVRYRNLCFDGSAIFHAWMEPFCAAAHLVHLAPADQYPVEEPAVGVNVAQWPSGTLIQLPACGTGFHPYGSSDVAQVAGFVSERTLAVIDGVAKDSQVWSWVRSEGFFSTLSVAAVCGPYVPKTKSIFDSVQLTRSFHDIYGG
ncbi:ThiF family adenylyltransferase [Pseudomonas syringae group genomosp. 3]|uniref:ThiF family adenylyltransferase n=1 Tax=Pseudomonas syringae group genomosp. 3 TaxID=251701 RepID=UPI0011C40851|nr:ThiF family adenylyltransferase [Pseudomonas syringae group genomosp. 3]